MITQIDKAFHLPADAAAECLGVKVGTGLTDGDVNERLARFGKNVLTERRPASLWRILLSQFNSLVIYLLLAAATAAFSFGEIVEGLSVLIVIILNAAIGFLMEFQAVRSMDALRKLARVRVRVRRNGMQQEILSDDLVPGDILLIEAGDVIAADARIATSARLEADESTLTGESVPVAKSTNVVAETAPLAERTNMLFKGTAITRGTAVAIVVSTGMQTELGAISELVQSARQEATPLEEKLDVFGQRLVWLALLLALAIVVAGFLRGDDFLLIVETAIALSVAAIPEGMPIVATIALARGMMRMARRDVIVRRLASVETLGGTNVICTDKTGTLTENRLTVSSIALASGTAEVQWSGEGRKVAMTGAVAKTSEAFRRLTEAMVLCNNASYVPDEDRGTGDPVETALLQFAFAIGQEYADAAAQWLRVEEEPFDSDTKIMATLHERQGEQRTAAKGAPEAMLLRCTSILDGDGRTLADDDKTTWLQLAEELSADGLRVLAFADKLGASNAKFGDLVFLGLVGFLDPPRPDVNAALQECAQAGIRVVMVTGDHPATAKSIAAKVHLIDDQHGELVIRGETIETVDAMSATERKELLRTRVFARVTPRQKLDLISLFQDNGDVVAMTGDGVNDAPALRKADIGIAMGKHGTQIAREAATMVLEDDAFSSIVEAVRQGRIIFDNIRRFVIYLLSCNISEIFIVAGAAFAGLPLPLLPLQILFLNLVTDVFPALALGVGVGDPGIMKQQPRNPKEALISKRLWIAIMVYGTVMTLSGIGVIFYCNSWLQLDPAVSNNIAFLSITIAQLGHVFNIAPSHQSFLVSDVVRNRFVWLALALCLLILAGAFAFAPVRSALSLTTEVFEYWYIVLAGSLAPALVNQALKRLKVIW